MEGAPTRVRNPFYLVVAGFYILCGLLQAIWYCWRKKFDVIHVHWPFPHAIWGYAASQLTGAPMVITFHGAEVLLCQKFFFVKYFLRHAVRNARAVICNSSFTAERVRELGVDKPIEIIPFGTTINVRPVVKQPTKQVKDILFSGRLIERKGVEYLLRATTQILTSVPVHVHIVGIGSSRPKLEQLASELGISDRVTFHGFVSNEKLSELYATADVFVLPAVVDERGDTEGLGVVLIEAITHSTPVVATNVGGIIDVIKHERTGLLVEQRNSGALAQAIVRVLSDDELRTHLIQNGLLHVQNYLDWELITDRLLAVYSQAIDSANELEKKAPPAIDHAQLFDEATLASEKSSIERLKTASRSGAGGSRAKTKRPSWQKFVMRAMISGAIIAALFTQISVSEVLNCLGRVSPGFVLFAWCYYALCQWVSAYRWQLLLRAKDVHVSLGQLFSYYMIGMFVNNFMPGSIGGDFVKSYYLYRRTNKLEVSVVSVFLERFTGLLGLCLLSIAALAFGFGYMRSPVIVVAVVGTSLALTLLVLSLWRLPQLGARIPILTRIMPARLISLAAGVYESLISYRHHASTIFAAVAISTVLQFMFAVYYALASVAMGIPIDLIYFVLFLPAVTLISLIPLSLGGLGIREAAMVILFGAAGVAQADILAMSLTVHVINMILSLLGGVLLIKHQAPPVRECGTA